MAEKFLFAIVVVFRPVLELPREPAIRRARDFGLEGPAGEGAGSLANVLLGVVAGAEAEQLQQLAAPVLVDRGPVVLVVVEPEHHRRVGRYFVQQLVVTGQTVLSEQFDLLQELVVIVDL